MRIGLIDVDGHNFPNLALMRISAYHKARGDDVEWWWGWEHYDIVYMSKVFSDAYSPDAYEPMNADKIIKGGTGYAISLVDGKEVYDKSKDGMLDPEIEKMFPDYSIYPQYDFAVAMTSRGCPRGCAFCHVVPKEGRASIKVADVSDFWRGEQNLIQVLDPNILACREKRDLLKQYRETRVMIDFNQGLDIRLLNDEDAYDLRHTRLKNVHFAWDNPNDDLRDKFRMWAERGIKVAHGRCGTVYCLTNFEDVSIEEHVERALERIYYLRSLNYDPYLMIYDKPHAAGEIVNVQRWCNNKHVFQACPNYEDYTTRRKYEKRISQQAQN